MRLPGLKPARSNLSGLNLPVASLAGATVGLIVALLFAVMPTAMLEDMAVDSGIAAVLSVAEPPLGLTARLVLVFLFGGAVGAMVWFAVFVLLGNRSIVVQDKGKADRDQTIVLRRADAHPDAPARRPLSASRDLGEPFFAADMTVAASVMDEESPIIPDPVVMPEPFESHVEPETFPEPKIAFASETVADPVPDAPPPVETEVPAERAIPADLDQPLAAFDPNAIPDEPADWFPTPSPLTPAPRRQTFDSSERFETFDLMPAPRRTPAPPSPPAAPQTDPSASIHALLDRLEKGVGRNEPGAEQPEAPRAPRAETLEEALVTLRRLAMRG